MKGWMIKELSLFRVVKGGRYTRNMLRRHIHCQKINTFIVLEAELAVCLFFPRPFFNYFFPPKKMKKKIPVGSTVVTVCYQRVKTVTLPNLFILKESFTFIQVGYAIEVTESSSLTQSLKPRSVGYTAEGFFCRKRSLGKDSLNIRIKGNVSVASMGRRKDHRDTFIYCHKAFEQTVAVPKQCPQTLW